MSAVRVVCLALIVAAAGFALRPAHAGCSDLPAPGVDWRSCNLQGISFPASDMSDGNLRGASLSNADHTGSNFSGIDGYRVRFVESILVDTVFDGAALTDARFDRADLSGASMRDVAARNAKFQFANLSGVDFTGANLRDVDLTGTDLSGAIWIDGERVCAEGSMGICR
ncbi:MAG: pentapeptide repeat-containing protein [Rhodospirillales bacterium]|nr:pentapeptide repeat-containing protein [Rhodospirillales bacterium]